MPNIIPIYTQKILPNPQEVPHYNQIQVKTGILLYWNPLMQQVIVFFLSISGKETQDFFLWAVYARKKWLEREQLSANRFHCCGITDNPGRFDSKSTQVTWALRGLKETRKERERKTWNKTDLENEMLQSYHVPVAFKIYLCICMGVCIIHCNVAVNDDNHTSSPVCDT